MKIIEDESYKERLEEYLSPNTKVPFAKKVRIALGMSMKEFANFTEVSLPSIQRSEKDQQKLGSEHIRRIISAVNGIGGVNGRLIGPIDFIEYSE